MSNSEAIKVNSKAAARIQELLDAAQRINEQVNAYVMGLGAGLDLPDGWQFDVRSMSFVPPAPVAPDGGAHDAE